MLIALCLTSSLEWAGQTSTQTPQPVQSSGATWTVSFIPGRSRERKSLAANPSGAPSSASGPNTLVRMVECGQTMAHLPQSMQIDGSQMGISAASDRFSHLAVPVGKAPSTGRALTGSRSPLPSSMRAVTRLTKSGACSDTAGRRWRVAVACGRHLHLCSAVQGAVDGGEVAGHDLLAAAAEGLLDPAP